MKGVLKKKFMGKLLIINIAKKGYWNRKFIGVGNKKGNNRAIYS